MLRPLGLHETRPFFPVEMHGSRMAVGYGGAPFFQRAWASIQLAVRARDLRRLHLDTPISLGIAVGFDEAEGG